MPASVAISSDISAGERAFQKCYACHSIDRTETGLTGPNLSGVVGRAIAAEPGFAYSVAMRSYATRHRVWTSKTLDSFLGDPQREAPGNDMGFFGMPDPVERQQLIAYLRNQ